MDEQNNEQNQVAAPTIEERLAVLEEKVAKLEAAETGVTAAQFAELEEKLDKAGIR